METIITNGRKEITWAENSDNLETDNDTNSCSVSKLPQSTSDKNFSESVMKQRDTNKEVAKMTSSLQHHKIPLKEIKESFLIGDSMCKGGKWLPNWRIICLVFLFAGVECIED